VTSLRRNPAALFERCSAVAETTRIPLEHVVKDFWITEALRAMVSAARAERVHLVFKGGTSLSKAYRLINRFSEDIDLLCVGSGGDNAVHSMMRRLHDAVADRIGVQANVDTAKSAKGQFRPAQFAYPGQTLLEGEVPGTIRVELSTWGGAIPSEVKELKSLVAEHAATLGSTRVGDEFESFEITVLRPERTLVEKLVILHDAATSQDEMRQRRTARHYYDIWCLLGHAETRNQLAGDAVMVLAEEVLTHNTASKTSATRRRPSGGFAESQAFSNRGPLAARDEYSKRVVPRLIWPGCDQPSYDDCLARVQQFASML